MQRCRVFIYLKLACPEQVLRQALRLPSCDDSQHRPINNYVSFFSEHVKVQELFYSNSLRFEIVVTSPGATSSQGVSAKLYSNNLLYLTMYLPSRTVLK